MSRRVVVEADGGSRGNPGPAGYGAVVRDADTGEVLAERAAGIGRATNNVAEYGGLIAGLTAVTELDPPPASVEVRMDSKLVVEQMSGRWQVKHPDMKPLAREAASLLRGLPRTTFTWVPRERNKHADRLANEAMDAQAAGGQWQPPSPAEVEPASGATPQRPWSSATADPTTFVLLRHGQTPLSVEKRFSGVGDPALTPLGEQQAAAAAARLARQAEAGLRVDAVVSSPLQRARRTAELAAAALGGLDVVVEDRLRETDFGAWEGLTFAEVAARWPDEQRAWLADEQVAPPGGESFAATLRRVRQARDALLAAHGPATLLVVSHVTPLKSLARLALGAGPEALHRLHLDLCALGQLDWFADGPAVLRRWNDTAHLEGVG